MFQQVRVHHWNEISIILQIVVGICASLKLKLWPKMLIFIKYLPNEIIADKGSIFVRDLKCVAELSMFRLESAISTEIRHYIEHLEPRCLNINDGWLEWAVGVGWCAWLWGKDMKRSGSIWMIAHRPVWNKMSKVMSKCDCLPKEIMSGCNVMIIQTQQNLWICSCMHWTYMFVVKGLDQRVVDTKMALDHNTWIMILDRLLFNIFEDLEENMDSHLNCMLEPGHRTSIFKRAAIKFPLSENMMASKGLHQP